MTKIKNAILCHPSRPDRQVTVELTAEGATITKGDLVGAFFRKTDWHNKMNDAYWIKFV